MNMNWGPLTNSDVVPIFPEETRRKVLPTFITRIVMGARVISPWRGKKDVVVIEDVYGATRMSVPDYKIAQHVADKITKELGLEKVIPAHQIVVIRDRAQEIIEAMTDERAGKHGIIMLRDNGGCGYWRMSLPSRYIDREGIYIDVTGGGVDFDHLLKYDTIFVQRVNNWDSYYVMERLKKAGKRLVYDIDDDLFSIPEDNPASKVYGRTELMAIVECMKLADVVTVTTQTLQDRMAQLLDGKFPVVIPNAIDTDDGWVPTPFTGSQDEWKRIFWQGSNTHEEDWNECFDAVFHVMRKRPNVRLTILGYLPLVVRERMTGPMWKGRIEFLGPMDPEAYFRLIKCVRAEVGLAPITSNMFAKGKSPIKWIENSMIGMPTVASYVGPYADVIDPEKDGFLCSTCVEWIKAIERCLDDERVRKATTENARTKIRNEFNIKKVAGIWRNVLLGLPVC